MFKVGDLVVYNPAPADGPKPPSFDLENKSTGMIVEIVAEHLYAVRWFNHPHSEIVGDDAVYAEIELSLVQKAARTNFF